MAEKKLVIPSKKYTGETAVVSARLPLDLIKKIDEINSYRNLITQGGLNNPP